MEEAYSIKIPVFEGPLDLLLHLIRENKIDVYDIPIALITHQYLEYIEMMKELNLDVAGEFLLMAATLIHIKSRMLLPVDEEVKDEEQEDPRFELVQRLLEYQTFKEVSLALQEKEDEWSNVFYRQFFEGDEKGKRRSDDDVLFSPENDSDGYLLETGESGSETLHLFDLNIFDLLSAFRKFLDKAPPEVVAITRETLTVKDRISFIMEKLENENAVRFEDLLGGNVTRSYLIVTFIAFLEILRLGLARAYQERDFGNIWIIRRQDPSHEAE
ncbi:MAG: segregation/condensation protein A [Thermodesulfovibrionales bacterium]|jgi:segregation and condensation protein A